MSAKLIVADASAVPITHPSSVSKSPFTTWLEGFGGATEIEEDGIAELEGATELEAGMELGSGAELDGATGLEETAELDGAADEMGMLLEAEAGVLLADTLEGAPDGSGEGPLDAETETGELDDPDG